MMSEALKNEKKWGKIALSKKFKKNFLNFEHWGCFQSDFLVCINKSLLLFAFFYTFYALLKIFLKKGAQRKNIKSAFLKLEV
jgi:hypothetical protein